ncbi:MAG: hypothetical protein NXI16_01570 [Alphaproteobacteria bacterium]|nr:hypothetical protein [Alphaproteobacteria bacterium]
MAAQKADKALVTLLLGEDYKRMWETVFRPAMDAYAQKHGYDVVTVDALIDDTDRGRARGPHWQKCLILDHPEVKAYEDVVWIDADIMINPHTSPCIVAHTRERAEATGRHGIGLVSHNEVFQSAERVENAWDRSFQAAKELFWQERGPTPEQRYEMAGLPRDVDDMANTGVMVLKPGRDEDLLHHVYEAYEENALSASEQMALCYEIFKQDRATPIDPRFNRVWTETWLEHYPFLFAEENRKDQMLIALCVNAAYHNCYFLHFIADGRSRTDAALVKPEFTSEQIWGL